MISQLQVAYVWMLLSAVVAPNCLAALYVNYSGDALPEDSSPAFEEELAAPTPGFTASVENGILSLTNPLSIGSLGYFRRDPMTSDDLAVQQFRVRLVDPVPSSPDILRGAVTKLASGSTTDPHFFR